MSSSREVDVRTFLQNELRDSSTSNRRKLWFGVGYGPRQLISRRFHVLHAWLIVILGVLSRDVLSSKYILPVC